MIGGDEAAGRLLAGKEPPLGLVTETASRGHDFLERLLVHRRLARARDRRHCT